MFITIKNREGEKIKVDVSQDECKNFVCLSPHKYQHRSYNGTEGSMTRSDKHYSCSHRNYHGCPDNPSTKKDEKKQE